MSIFSIPSAQVPPRLPAFDPPASSATPLSLPVSSAPAFNGQGVLTFPLSRFSRCTGTTQRHSAREAPPSRTCSGTSSLLGGASSTTETRDHFTWQHQYPKDLALKVVLQVEPSQHRVQDQSLSTPGASRVPGAAVPALIIQSSKEILESLGLDYATVRTCQLKALGKGCMLGFQYYHRRPGSSAAEHRKFQARFKSSDDCRQCAAVLKRYIECRYFDQDGTLCDSGSPISPNSSNTAATAPAAISPVVSATPSSSTSIMGQKRSSQESLHRAKSGASQSQVLSSQEQTPFATPTAITPRFGTQPIPVSSVSAAASQSEKECHQQKPYQQAPEMDVLGTLLDLPDPALQEEVNAILSDPRFDLLIIKVGL